jgi:hypothetical protein
MDFVQVEFLQFRYPTCFGFELNRDENAVHASDDVRDASASESAAAPILDEVNALAPQKI